MILGFLLALTLAIDCALLADTLQGALTEAPYLQGYFAGLAHAAGFVLTAATAALIARRD